MAYITGGAEINTTGQKPLEIPEPAGVTSYDLRNTDPLISPQAITNVTGGEIKDAVVYGIYDGMEIGYTYTENGASIRAAGWTCAGLAGGKHWTGTRRPKVPQAPEQMKYRYEKILREVS